MDQRSPRSLQDFCICVLVENPNTLWKWKNVRVSSKPTEVEWRDPDLFLHHQFADILLGMLSCNGKLGNRILSTFTQEHVCLKNVKISDTERDNITEDGLQVLSDHKLISLNIELKRPVDICTVFECIGNKSNGSLQHLLLHIPEKFWPSDDDLAGQSVVETLSRFSCLKSVDVGQTGLTNTMLTILCKSLLHVQNLNLSWNFTITDISPLKNCQKTLKSLSVGGLPDMTAESAMATFVTLTGLNYLDVSMVSGTYYDSYRAFDSLSHKIGKKVFTADMLLEMPDTLPNLVCLDLSGRTLRREQALSQFLEAHQSLQMLVLWGSAACHFTSLQDFRPRLTVGGDATLEQYAAVLRHWMRNGQYKGFTYYCVQPFFVISKLGRDLNATQFPPCHDDQLVQAVLSICLGIPGLRREKVASFQVYPCLEIISHLLEKGIVRYLEHDTKEHLRQFCYKVVRQSRQSEIRKIATQILQALELVTTKPAAMALEMVGAHTPHMGFQHHQAVPFVEPPSEEEKKRLASKQLALRYLRGRRKKKPLSGTVREAGPGRLENPCQEG